MPIPRRHHYISQFYLRRFADPDTLQVSVVDTERRRAFSAPTQGIAHERDFHRIDVPGSNPNIIETTLADFEGKVATALSHVLAREAVRLDEDGQLLLYYMSLLNVKNPAMRETIDGFIADLMTRITQHEAQDPVRFHERIAEMIADGAMEADTDAYALREQILSGNNEIALAREAHLSMEFNNARDLLEFFTRRRWTFLRAHEGQFITSDRPIVLTRDHASQAPLGLANRDVVILFALSPTAALLGGFDLPAIAVDLTRAEVAESNGQIMSWSRAQIYSQSPDFEYKLGRDGAIASGRDFLAR